jgi:hypothetical protein
VIVISGGLGCLSKMDYLKFALGLGADAAMPQPFSSADLRAAIG